MVPKTVDIREITRALYNYSLFGIGIPSPISKQGMLSHIEEAEAQSSNWNSFELEFAIGTALSAYVFNFMRGEERKPYLERMILHIENAYRLSKNRQWDVFSFITQEPQLHIALTLGILLVREAPIRDLNKAINYLDPIYRTTTTYEPAFCYYAEALYMRGAYLDAARLATAIHQRAQADPKWKSLNAPMGIAASAYRAEAKRCKRAGRLEEAVESFRQLMQTGMGTTNDQKLLDNLSDHLSKQ